MAVSLVMLYLTLIWGLSLGMHAEAADRDLRLSQAVGCAGLSTVIDAVYAAGGGAEVEYRLRGNYTVYPGIVDPADGGYFCELSGAAVKEPKHLTGGTYVVRNRGGWIEFT
ncbi:MAG: hypothetical protein V1875_01450 [Candidatus Altiarchaeota archaeon]